MASWNNSELLGMSKCGQTLYKKVPTSWNVTQNITKFSSASNRKNNRRLIGAFWIISVTCKSTLCWSLNSDSLKVKIQRGMNVCLVTSGDWNSVGTLQLCRSLKKFCSLFVGFWAQRPQQNWLSIFSYSIVAFLDLKSQISRENTCLKNLNKLQITAFEGKCPVLVSWNHTGFRLHFFISLALITVTCSTHSQGLSSASLIAFSLRRKNIHFSS